MDALPEDTVRVVKSVTAACFADELLGTATVPLMVPVVAAGVVVLLPPPPHPENEKVSMEKAKIKQKTKKTPSLELFCLCI